MRVKINFDNFFYKSLAVNKNRKIELAISKPKKEQDWLKISFKIAASYIEQRVSLDVNRSTVAQMAERVAANRKIRGSNPAWIL